jgi:hypothetical protein
MDLAPAKPNATRSWRLCAGAMGLFTCLFFLRVIGQAVQLWLPQAWLPVFAEWQGSPIPYPLLLAIQLGILVAMTGATWRAWNAVLAAFVLTLAGYHSSRVHAAGESP